MTSHKRHLTSSMARAAALVLAVLTLACLPAMAGSTGPEEDGDFVVLGGQYKDVDGERPAKFERNNEYPSGVVLDRLRFSIGGDENWVQIQAWDATQLDERVLVKAGFGRSLRIRANYQSLPYRYGDGARFVLGDAGANQYGPTYRIGDFIQRTMEDPDGNGIPFFASAAETANDNALVRGLTNDLLSGTDSMSLQSRRRTGGFGAGFQPTKNWSLDFDVQTERRNGNLALGSGTYQRISDVNGDGITDYDYFFSVRGLEMPAPVEYRTTRVEASGGYANDRAFINLGWALSDFDNDYQAVTYDNPFWYEGVNATSGSKRGLWEEGRVSLEPSNQAWQIDLSGGMNFSKNTRLTASLVTGKHTQDDTLLPITTNPATIGTADINRDGRIDRRDDPTLAPAAIEGMPDSIDGTPVVGQTLDASSDTLAFNVAVTSRPVDGLKLTGRFRSYSYEGQEGILAVPARTEYIESKVKLDFKGDMILHVPVDYTRRNFDLEAAYDIKRGFQIKGYYGRKSYDWEIYQDPDGNSSRDSGTRAVEGTNDDTFGVSARFANNGLVSGRATYEHSQRRYQGEYTTGFSGENQRVRQYDISDRDRNAFNFQVDVMPTDAVTFGIGYRYAKDDYPETELGLNEAKTNSFDLSVNYAANEKVNLFVYADRSKWDADMHLRTKCSNCSIPAGFSPWDVPNYDWFSTYNDESVAVGGGVGFALGSRTSLDFLANYSRGLIEQGTQNPDTPRELNPGNPRFGTVAEVALGYDFPDQKNTLVRTELKLAHQLTDMFSFGLWWLYEDFDLEDFQWDGLDPYGANFLTVDDATRYLILDSRYGDYSAHVLQGFMKVQF